MNKLPKHTFWREELLASLLRHAIQRRPGITALALFSPGGRVWASALPLGTETESVAAIAGSVSLLGRRVALEQLGSDMRQVYVEGESGYAILRAIGDTVVLLTVAAKQANLALVLHDIDQIEDHVAEVMGLSLSGSDKWIEAVPAIEKLRQLAAQGEMPGVRNGRLKDLRAKLDSLDLGFFPERVTAIRTSLEAPQCLEEVEAELIALELDVMTAIERQIESPNPVADDVGDAHDEPGALYLNQEGGDEAGVLAVSPDPDWVGEPVDGRNSFVRRTLRWLASIIESED
jgi:predicted regulator of Ras-like GTPase activity (Roadblock/LC7/MglB family)